MSDELDINKVVAEFIKLNFDEFYEIWSSILNKSSMSIRLKLQKTYKEYLERTLEKYSRSKSFFVRTEAQPIYNFFIPPDISNEQRSLKAPNCTILGETSPASIIAGSGGCGKTMFMRHLLISSIVERVKTPVYVELRQLNGRTENIRNVLLETLNANGLDAEDAYLELALKAGHFVLLLDGFDELELKKRDGVAKEIVELFESYPKNWIVLSSRPDSKLEGWAGFVQYSIDPFDLPRAIELVEKLPFDDQIKIKFIDDLSKGLYEKHNSFLSNPLLLSIMLLTYSDVAHIPTKLSVFYNQAYESLFQKHDALKAGFQRERRTKLDIQDFAKVFSAFCVQSYDKRDFSFSRSKALEYFDESKTITGLSFDSSGMLDDSIQAVCIMIEDGLEITFAHRSFQEYFTARFISSAPPEIKEKLIQRFSSEVGMDSVMQLLFELDQYSVEKNYILPSLNKLQESMGFTRKIGITHYLRFLKLFCEEFRLETHLQRRRHSVFIKNNQLFELLMFVRSNYPDFYPLMTEEKIKKEDKKIEEAFDKSTEDNKRIVAKSLKTTTPFVRAMFESDFIWAGNCIKNLFVLRKQIQVRHAEAKSSLNAILKNKS